MKFSVEQVLQVAHFRSITNDVCISFQIPDKDTSGTINMCLGVSKEQALKGDLTGINEIQLFCFLEEPPSAVIFRTYYRENGQVSMC